MIFQIERWDEHAWNKTEAEIKLTRASIAKRYTGDIQGKGKLEHLRIDREDGSAALSA